MATGGRFFEGGKSSIHTIDDLDKFRWILNLVLIDLPQLVQHGRCADSTARGYYVHDIHTRQGPQ